MSFDPTWEQVHRSREWGWNPDQWFHDALRRRYSGTVVLRTDSRDVLDLGCGGGAITVFLAKQGFRVHGIDGSQTAIDSVRRKLDGEHLRAYLAVLDANRLLDAFAPDSFDWVLDVACLQHCPPESQREIVRQIRQVLRPGGWVYSRMAATGSWGQGTGRRIASHCWTDIAEGPAAGMGVTTFATRRHVLDLWGWLDVPDRRITLDSRQLSEGLYSRPAGSDGLRPRASGGWRWWQEWTIEGVKRGNS